MKANCMTALTRDRAFYQRLLGEKTHGSLFAEIVPTLGAAVGGEGAGDQRE